MNLTVLKQIISGCWVVIEGDEIYNEFLMMALRGNTKSKVSDPLNIFVDILDPHFKLDTKYISSLD